MVIPPKLVFSRLRAFDLYVCMDNSDFWDGLLTNSHVALRPIFLAGMEDNLQAGLGEIYYEDT